MGSATLLAETKVIARLLTRKPIFVGYNVTNRCNMRCTFCSVPDLPNPDMTLPQVESALDRVAELGIPVVGVTGGEPFLRKDLAAIMKAIEVRGMKSTLVTNGEALTRARMEELGELKNIVHFALSVDSLDRDTYASLRGRKNLPETLSRFLNIRRYGPPAVYKLNVVVTPYNVDEIETIVRFAEAAGVALSFIPLNVGPGGFHRGKDDSNIDGPARQKMADAFDTLRALKLGGAPLWDHRDFYLMAKRYLLGEPLGPCGAGELFLDLRSDGGLAHCNEMEHFVSLLEVDHFSLKDLARHRQEWADRIEKCSSNQACCYTCSYNITATAQNLPAYIFDYLKLRWRG
jgi:MoaA/NifB/PqqE/SkfB family radical SAM enzyme